MRHGCQPGVRCCRRPQSRAVLDRHLQEHLPRRRGTQEAEDGARLLVGQRWPPQEDQGRHLPCVLAPGMLPCSKSVDKRPCANKDQGTEDAPFGVTVPKEQIEMFTSSKEATLEFIEGGNHYLNATNPKEVGSAILKMASKYQ